MFTAQVPSATVVACQLLPPSSVTVTTSPLWPKPLRSRPGDMNSGQDQ
jgi:hypothetical protein